MVGKQEEFWIWPDWGRFQRFMQEGENWEGALSMRSTSSSSSFSGIALRNAVGGPKLSPLSSQNPSPSNFFFPLRRPEWRREDQERGKLFWSHCISSHTLFLLACLLACSLFSSRQENEIGLFYFSTPSSFPFSLLKFGCNCISLGFMGEIKMEGIMI